MDEALRQAEVVIPEQVWRRGAPKCSRCRTPLGRRSDVLPAEGGWAHAFCALEADR